MSSETPGVLVHLHASQILPNLSKNATEVYILICKVLVVSFSLFYYDNMKNKYS